VVITPLLLFFALGVASSGVLADSADPSQQLFGGLPLDLAIKQVRGNGTLAFAAFEDPNCPHCWQMAKDTADLSDVTIYTFIYPILSDASKDVAKAIWCAPNRTKAWRAWMISRTVPTWSECNTESITKILALGKAMKISSVPTIFLANGDRISGAKSRMELEMAISSPKVRTFQSRQRIDEKIHGSQDTRSMLPQRALD
jgi:thiol:disulfide interchange protein DsbC